MLHTITRTHTHTHTAHTHSHTHSHLHIHLRLRFRIASWAHWIRPSAVVCYRRLTVCGLHCDCGLRDPSAETAQLGALVAVASAVVVCWPFSLLGRGLCLPSFRCVCPQQWARLGASASRRSQRGGQCRVGDHSPRAEMGVGACEHVLYGRVQRSVSMYWVCACLGR